MSDMVERIKEATEAIGRVSALRPEIGIILGTGLSGLAERIEVEARIDYGAIPFFPRATVESHAGELLLGSLAGKPVVALSGRVHAYEGHSLQEIAFPVRVVKALGIHTLVVFNAAGGLNPEFSAGDLMVITDHINLMGDNPLIGPNDEALGPRFPDMSEPYTRSLIALAEAKAMEQGTPLRRGVYLAVTGPCLETRAEYRFMRAIGADAVGMSTVPEVIVAVHAGLRVLGFSAITDECKPDALQPADVNAIVATARRIEPRLTAIVEACIAEIQPGAERGK
jgi:purine-nucleoside phosphorylase